MKDIKIKDDEIYPKGQWVTIARESEKGKVNDDDIYFYLDDEEYNTIEVNKKLMLDEEFLVIDLENYYDEGTEVTAEDGEEFEKYIDADGKRVLAGTPIGKEFFKDGMWELKLYNGISIDYSEEVEK